MLSFYFIPGSRSEPPQIAAVTVKSISAAVIIEGEDLREYAFLGDVREVREPHPFMKSV